MKSKIILSMLGVIFSFSVLLGNANKASALEYYSGDYDFGTTSFSNYVWVKSGAYFTNFGSVNLETADYKDVRVEFWNTSGRKVYSQTLTFDMNHWSSVYFDDNGNYYKIKLVNASGTGTADLKRGEIY